MGLKEEEEIESFWVEELKQFGRKMHLKAENTESAVHSEALACDIGG